MKSEFHQKITASSAQQRSNAVDNPEFQRKYPKSGSTVANGIVTKRNVDDGKVYVKIPTNNSEIGVTVVQSRCEIFMNLEEAQNTVWIHQQEAPRTTQESMAKLSQSMIDCIHSFQEDRLLAAQSFLEDTLAQVLITMKTLNISPEQGLSRSVERMQKAAKVSRVFHIYPDHIEIQVGLDVRGGWPLSTQEDYESALALARTFGCEVMHHDAQQLDMFKSLTPSKRVRPTVRQRQKPPLPPRSGQRPNLTLITNN